MIFVQNLARQTGHREGIRDVHPRPVPFRVRPPRFSAATTRVPGAISVNTVRTPADGRCGTYLGAHHSAGETHMVGQSVMASSSSARSRHGKEIEHLPPVGENPNVRLAFTQWPGLGLKTPINNGLDSRRSHEVSVIVPPGG